MSRSISIRTHNAFIVCVTCHSCLQDYSAAVLFIHAYTLRPHQQLKLSTQPAASALVSHVTAHSAAVRHRHPIPHPVDTIAGMPNARGAGGVAGPDQRPLLVTSGTDDDCMDEESYDGSPDHNKEERACDAMDDVYGDKSKYVLSK